jgi:hypothetical protein
MCLTHRGGDLDSQPHLKGDSDTMPNSSSLVAHAPAPTRTLPIGRVTNPSTTLTVWPATLRLDQAASYSGLSVDTFKLVCPIKPIEFTQSSKGHRYLRVRLDEWLSLIDPNVSVSPERKFGSKLSGVKSEA